jgi:hypothetical protein
MSLALYAFRQSGITRMRMGDTTRSRAMKVTTVRFSEELWALLESEAAHAGVSISHYVREAALARAAFAAGARAGVPSELLAAWSGARLDREPAPIEETAATERLIAALTRINAQQTRSDSAALGAESRQAKRKAEELQRESMP